jgi:hypothetical protein
MRRWSMAYRKPLGQTVCRLPTGQAQWIRSFFLHAGKHYE